MRSKAAIITALFLSVCVTQAGEWMFRLRDAHVQLRKALFDKDADAAWEHVDRSTRQQAGLLAGQIRKEFDKLPEPKKKQLREALGVESDDAIREIQGKHILVAKFFMDAHPQILVGERDETKLKDHGTRMAGPTGITVHKKTPDEVIVPYRFTTEGHFGGQAMDYRAMLEVPSLEHIMGSPPPMEQLTAEETAKQAVAVFLEAQRAFKDGRLDDFWALLDCDSQSQANHFADQAKERGGKEAHAAHVLNMLGMKKEDLSALDGHKVWAHAWAKEDLFYFINATDAKYVTAEGYDKALVPIPLGYKRRDKANPEAMIEFQADGRTWQIPARVNYRNGQPELKIFLRPPFYLRLRAK